MALTLLLDSVILIDHLNGIVAASRYLARVRTEAAISVITRAEVLTGVSASDLAAVQAFLDQFPHLEIDHAIADLAAALRRSQGWKLPDALQAALARHHKLKLATRNLKDFPPARHRFVVAPYAT